MRTLVIILVTLAASKVAAVEWLHRSASDDVIVATYAARALDACNRDAHRKALGIDAAAWSPTTPMHLEIGQRRSDVGLWQVDNPAWAKRFRQPFLRVTAGAAGTQVDCTYDLLSGVAVARRT